MTEEQSLYGFNQETPEQLGSAPIAPGIRDNIKLVDVEYGPAKEGSSNMRLAFHFEDSDGKALSHTEWPIDIEETKQRATKQGDDPNTAVQKRFRAQGVRIKHIVTKVIPAENAAVPKVNSFQQYAQAVINLLKPHLPAGPFRLKVILNNKDYSSLPPYTPFIEKQTDKPTELRIDKNERIAPKKSAQSGSLDMPDMDGAPPISDDDVPF